jgi:CheY-like chemotaxis protein
MSTAKRVLVVDDEDKILFVLSRALARLGAECQVHTASSGKEALEMAQEASFDLIVTDLRMPEMDGIVLTQALRSLAFDPVVIWMTAYNCCTMEAEAERLRVHRCLDKPIEIGEIRRIVSEALWGADGAAE